MSDPLLSVANLGIVLGDRAVIQGLSFELQATQSLAVIGPNGAGKTVLLKALLGLIPHTGTIRWSPGARLGYVPQKVEADRQLPLRLQDLLAAKAAVLKLSHADIERVSSEVGLTPDMLGTSIGHLSGGQFQKALIAFALLGEPNVILFDEPTASLDELAEERVYDMLHALQHDKHITVILVSHDLSVVYRYADMVLCLSKGTPCMGPPREVLTPETLEALYAAPPKYYRHAEGR
ncbi:MAG TPA: metal ABC transporter ATP-binding protein [Candidatus Acidoferrales bacterium]|jgi:zinc transport system ATP-binding protein|nr:metal ABC transporter ATP-binding protein [Candidatus Acidoferrales bacterium]